MVGSGFAGTILARVLHRQGHDVILCERDRHPRFALGESSTPLAALSLERLAARYGLEDLRHLAAYGRWLEHRPSVRRGLKRGFTFYRHFPGEAFRNGPGNENRLLVAASPADRIADAHWLRADVDAHLVDLAVREGVDYREGLGLEACDIGREGVRLAGRWGRDGATGGRRQERPGPPVRLAADLVVDASGAGGFLARALDIPPGADPPSLRTGLLFGHFEGVGSFREVAEAGGAELPAGPYPDERAAVHHLLDEGWMYVLPFDHGVVSAGLVLERGSGEGRPPAAAGGAAAEMWTGDPARAWRTLLARYPTLRDQFAGARPVEGIRGVPRLQRRLDRAAGARWAILPHGYCFHSPMFSTGIAWSLRAVERLAGILEPGSVGVRSDGRDPAPGDPIAAGLRRYGALLAREADHLGELLRGAYRLRRDFDRFTSWSFLYFAAASWTESAERLAEPPADGWAWKGFLGADDPPLRAALAAGREAGRGSPGEFGGRIRRAIESRNVAGLADPARRRMYPVDLEALVEAAPRLGLSREEVRRNLPRLRGFTRGE